MAIETTEYSSIARDQDWIAVQVRTGFEQSVGKGLDERGYERFVPLAKDRRVRRAREVTVEQPLFPGYVFCRYLQAPLHRIVDTPAVIKLVGFAKTPTPISPEEIEAIRRIVDSGFYSSPWRFVQVGQSVMVKHGALRGLRGTLVSVRKGLRFVISVGLLGRAVAVEVDAEDVSPVCESNVFTAASLQFVEPANQWAVAPNAVAAG